MKLKLLCPAHLARKNPFIARRQKAYLNFELKDLAAGGARAFGVRP